MNIFAFIIGGVLLAAGFTIVDAQRTNTELRQELDELKQQQAVNQSEVITKNELCNGIFNLVVLGRKPKFK